MRQGNWTGKYVITLKIPYINIKSTFLEKNIKQMTCTTFFAAKPRVVLQQVHY